jgi:nicotinate phosphoribosyltransferase
MSGDIMSIEDDQHAGEPLLQPVMQGGRRIAPGPTLADCRARAARDLARLPQPLHRLEPGSAYPVEVTGVLAGLAAEVDRRIAKTGTSHKAQRKQS